MTATLEQGSQTAVQRKAPEGEAPDVTVKTTPIALRLPNELLARIDARREQLRKMGGIEPNRTDMIKFLIERGLAAVDSEEKPSRKR